MKIHFVRHAEADYSLENKPGEFPGVPLTKVGERQAYDLSSKLSNFKYDFILCSDMLRTKQTLFPSLKRLKTIPLYDSRLREISDTIDEPKENQIQRMESFLESLKSLQGNVLIIAHFGVIKYLSRRLGEEVVSPKNGGYYLIVPQDNLA
ncbi:histidine phosphatase family protein [Candidatus Woesearchaeota archaeon]|nr:histidine phosphatase family protein [Candidatus Woesearchaeota archaeon]